MKVLLTQTGTLATVSKLMEVDGVGDLCLDGHPAALRMFLDSEYGPAKVYLHDLGKTWKPYAELN
jgi:hypothetical protein